MKTRDPMPRTGGLTAAIGAALLLAVTAGCSKAPNDAGPQVAGGGKAAHTHDLWWCGEHGVPEAECGQCSATAAAAFQRKGDWCNEHQRPDSQCFVCHPDYEADFAARYEAKYGKKPPKPEA